MNLLLLIGVLHVLGNQVGLILQLLPLLLEPFLLEVWNEHASDLPLIIQELSNSPLNLDRG